MAETPPTQVTRGHASVRTVSGCALGSVVGAILGCLLPGGLLATLAGVLSPDHWAWGLVVGMAVLSGRFGYRSSGVGATSISGVESLIAFPWLFWAPAVMVLVGAAFGFSRVGRLGPFEGNDAHSLWTLLGALSGSFMGGMLAALVTIRTMHWNGTAWEHARGRSMGRSSGQGASVAGILYRSVLAGLGGMAGVFVGLVFYRLVSMGVAVIAGNEAGVKVGFIAGLLGAGTGSAVWAVRAGRFTKHRFWTAIPAGLGVFLGAGLGWILGPTLSLGKPGMAAVIGGFAMTFLGALVGAVVTQVLSESDK